MVYFRCPIIGIIFAFALPISVGLPFHETKNLFKHQLHLAGVSRSLYWLTNFVGDTFYSLLLCLCVIICIITCDSIFENYFDWSMIFVLMLLYSFNGQILAYITTFYFKSKTSAYMVLFCICFASIAVPGFFFQWQEVTFNQMALAASSKNINEQHVKIEHTISTVLSYVVMIIPPIAFNQGLNNLFLTNFKLKNCQNKLHIRSDHKDIYHECWDMGCDMKNWNILQCSEYNLWMYVWKSGIMTAIGFLLLDLVVVVIILCLLEKQIVNVEEYDKYRIIVTPKDPEVIREAENVERTLKGIQIVSTSNKYKVLVSKVHKR